MDKRKRMVALIALLLAVALVLGIVAMLIPTRVSAASSSEIRSQINELEGQKAEIEAQMAALQEQMTDNLNEMKDTVEQKQRIDQQVFLLHKQIDTINEQIAAYGVLIADKQDELDAAEERYDTLSEQNRARVRAMEEEGTLSYWSVLFKANSFSDLLDRLNMIEEIAAADQRRLKELDQAAEAVRVARAELQTEKEGLEAKQQELQTAKVELEGKSKESEELLKSLVARGEEYVEYMADAEQVQNELMQEIALKEEEYDQAAYLEWLATYVPPTTAAPTQPSGGEEPEPTSYVPPSDDYWVRPVDWYIITDRFGMRYRDSGAYVMHYGVDLACNEGMPIYASRGGVVTTATYHWSFGNYVTINHGDGYRSLYAHMIYYTVSEGDYVAAGQVIGYVGSTGDSSGPHLHFGISYNGVYVDPLGYI